MLYDLYSLIILKDITIGAAHGLDLDDIKFVIKYNNEYYIHRKGDFLFFWPDNKQVGYMIYMHHFLCRQKTLKKVFKMTIFNINIPNSISELIADIIQTLFTKYHHDFYMLAWGLQSLSRLSLKFKYFRGI